MKFGLRAFRTDPAAPAEGACGTSPGPQASRLRGVNRGRHACAPGKRRPDSTKRRAFTLAEVLAALLMMAIVIPVAMEGMSVASRVGILGQRKASAMRVAERILNELIVENQTQQNSASGTAADGETNYPWSMKAQSWPEDAMIEMTVTVTFTVQGNEYDISASTLIPQSGTVVEGAAITQ